jgi:cyclopropane-fatty-acyl-phospholipid synthase
MWLLDKMLAKLIRVGQLVVTDHDGSVHRYGDPGAAPVCIRFTDAKAAMHVARDPRVGAGEAYMDGRMVVEPPHDIRDMVLLIMGNAARPGQSVEAPGGLRRTFDTLAWQFDQFNFRQRASRNVKHHYDLSREFYELFLDEDRHYTMAYFTDPANSLEQAQRDKMALLAAKLRLEPGEGKGLRVLDIGCGWGGFALYLHRQFGVEVLGVSLAPDQVRFAQERAQAAGVSDKVRFELIDYRDVTGRFDRITSVGMIEHVGARHFGEYFAKTFDLLADNGIMLTHTIGRTGRPGTTDKWTRKHVFPGGYVPALSELEAALERSGWKLGDVEVLRLHYAYTLAEWYRRTTVHAAKITALYDERFTRMWQFYLAGAEQAFRTGSMVNFHIQSVKRQAVLPLTRDYIQHAFNRLSAHDQG